jgi:CMP/dCMP kinase
MADQFLVAPADIAGVLVNVDNRLGCAGEGGGGERAQKGPSVHVRPEYHYTEEVIIAIDGPAGAGKSTVARRVAERLGFVYIDTGAMYRAVGLAALRDTTDLEDAEALAGVARAARIEFTPGTRRLFLNGQDVTDAIRTRDVSEAASRVSAVPAVRRILVEQQRRLADSNDVVLEGRDIGTVVFPQAEVKIFLDADPHARARRRHLETGTPLDQVAIDMQERDERDRRRADSPLTQAPDATYLDTTGLSLEEVEQTILELVHLRSQAHSGKEHSR